MVWTSAGISVHALTKELQVLHCKQTFKSALQAARTHTGMIQCCIVCKPINKFTKFFQRTSTGIGRQLGN